LGAYLRTFGLFVLLTFIFVIFGWVIGSLWFGAVTGIFLFLGLAVLMNVIAYFASDRIVLWSYRAKLVTEAEAPGLYRIVRQVTQQSNLPMPKVAIVPTQTPNAFATGRNPQHAVVAVTEGILSMLTEDELRGVLAHEVSHVRNRDILVMSVAATLAGAISFMARWFGWNMMLGGSRDRNSNGVTVLIALIGMILAPIAALLVQLAISRSREYKADYTGAKTIGQPIALASALEKLEIANRRRPIAFGSPASQSLFIVNPFQGRQSGMPSDAFQALRTSRPAATRSPELVPDVSPMSRVQVLDLVAHVEIRLHDLELLEVVPVFVDDRRPTVLHKPDHEVQVAATFRALEQGVEAEEMADDLLESGLRIVEAE